MLIPLALGYALAALGTVGTLLPFLRYDDYWIRMWDYPRAQLAVLLAVAVALLGWVVAAGAGHAATPYALAAAALALALQVFRILPYTPLWARQVPTAAPADRDADARGRELHLIISNVLQSNPAHDRLLALVARERPDLLLTLETDAGWEADLDAALAGEYPHTIKVPRDNRYGMHLYSRLPLRGEEVRHLVSGEFPSLYTEVRLRDGTWVRLYALHPPPPSPTEESASTGRDGELARLGKVITATGNARVIVAGDLNDVAWSHSTRLFQRLSGLLDPRRGRGLFATFHADHWWARWPLDHVFHAREFHIETLRRLPHVGSDHFPVSVRLRYVPAERDRVEEPAPEEDDREEADRTIALAERGEVDGLLVRE